MTKFARLEEHNGLQVLAYIEADQNDDGTEWGPCLIKRCDPSISVTIKHGPWPDTEEGWAVAEKEMEGADLKEFAESAVQFVANMGSQNG